jgi:hypothetical protein
MVGLPRRHGRRRRQAFLDRIITGLEADPTRFRAMNPDNGWGNYDQFLALLKKMRDAIPEWPTVWSVSG